MRVLFRVYLVFNHFLLVRSQCPLNAAYHLNTSSPAPVNCEDVITLHDRTTFRFNCGPNGSFGDVHERCQPPRRKVIRYCGSSFDSHHYYFVNMCMNDTTFSQGNHNSLTISYPTMASFDLSSVNMTSNCTGDFTNRVILTNNSALIKSPKWPSSYSSVLNKLDSCRWKIRVPGGKRLKLFYMYLHLEQPRPAPGGIYSNHSRCTPNRDNIDSLLVQGWKDNTVVDRQHYCGYNPSFIKYYDRLDSLEIELVVNATTVNRSSDIGFVIGVVVVDKAYIDNSWLEQYWWIIPIVLFFSVVIVNCLWKKINHSHHKHRKQQERAFTSSLTVLPKSIASERHPSIGQHRSISSAGGMDNLGQVSDNHLEIKVPVTTKISFSPDVDVFG